MAKTKQLRAAIKLHQRHLDKPKTATDASQRKMMKQMMDHLRKEMGEKLR